MSSKSSAIRSVFMKKSRASAARTIQSAFRRRRARPSRVRVSKSRYTLNRAIAKQLNNMTENKFQGYNGDCLMPQEKPSGQQPLSYIFLNTGQQLPSAGPFQPMDLYKFPQGDTGNERNGSYMFIKKSHLKMEIQMLPKTEQDVRGLNSTTEFRLMIVKANRKFNKLGQSPVAGSSLFLDTQNNQFGFGVAGIPSTASTFLNQKQPINKRKWLVYKDTSFTLTPPAQEILDNANPTQFGYNTSNSKYPVKKFISCDLPIFKKCHFEDSTDVPSNVDTQWLIILQAVRSNYCGEVKPPLNYRMNVVATTSASDN